MCAEKIKLTNIRACSQSFFAYFPTISAKSYRVKNMVYQINGMVYYDAASLKKYGEICLECIDRAWKVYAIAMLAIVASFMCALFGPIYVFVTTNQKSSMFEFKIPFLVNDPNLEFIVNGIFQVISGLFVALGNMGIEGFKILYMNSLDLSTKIMNYEIDELSTKLVAKKTVSKSEMEFRVLRMCHQIESTDR